MPLYAEHIKKLETLKKYSEQGDKVWEEYIEELLLEVDETDEDADLYDDAWEM